MFLTRCLRWGGLWGSVLLLVFYDGAGRGEEKSSRIDPSRPHITKLKEGEKTRFNDFIYPYLIVQTAVIRSQAPDQVAEQLKALLKEQALPIRGHFSTSGISPEKLNRENLPLLKPAVTGSQLSGLDKCDNKFCVMKLQTELEKPQLTSSKAKLTTFHQIVVDRVKAFLLRNQLRGYEDRLNNEASVKKMLGLLTFLKEDHPRCGDYFPKYFWTKAKGVCFPSDSLLREEVVLMEGTILQPVLRISEVFEFKERVNDISRFLFIELHIYSNHYFDSSLRVYEVLPSPANRKKTLVAITDVMEIDELAKSGVVRFLYQGKMTAAVQEVQDRDLGRIK